MHKYLSILVAMCIRVHSPMHDRVVCKLIKLCIVMYAFLSRYLQITKLMQNMYTPRFWVLLAITPEIVTPPVQLEHVQKCFLIANWFAIGQQRAVACCIIPVWDHSNLAQVMHDTYFEQLGGSQCNTFPSHAYA